MSDDIELKFRHVSGDIGPLKVPGSSSIVQVKELVYAQWPKGETFAVLRAVEYMNCRHTSLLTERDHDAEKLHVSAMRLLRH